MKVSGTRDYSRFLREDGRLNVWLLPRRVYTRLVHEMRQQPEVIDEVFAQLYFAWDLEDRARRAAEQGREVTKAQLAQEIMDEADDGDWWRILEAFEQYTIRHFGDDPQQWAWLIDPVYDEQEANGWRRLQ